MAVLHVSRAGVYVVGGRSSTDVCILGSRVRGYGFATFSCGNTRFVWLCAAGELPATRSAICRPMHADAANAELLPLACAGRRVDASIILELSFNPKVTPLAICVEAPRRT